MNADLEGMVPVKESLTCANHSGEEMVLDEIGWNHFICPKCGHDYSIGRRIAVLKHPVLRLLSHHDTTVTHGRSSGECC